MPSEPLNPLIKIRPSGQPYIEIEDLVKRRTERLMPSDNAAALKPCGECRMLCSPGEYHPYAACVLYKQLGQADKVKSCLDSVIQYATRDDDDRYKQGVEDAHEVNQDCATLNCPEIHQADGDYQRGVGDAAKLVEAAMIGPTPNKTRLVTAIRALPVSTTPKPDIPFCGCGRPVLSGQYPDNRDGCEGCGLHPFDCSCFPVGYDHELDKATTPACEICGEKGRHDYAKHRDAPAPPATVLACVLCGHEDLFSSDDGFCRKPVRTEAAKDKSTAETHADDFTACGCHCQSPTAQSATVPAEFAEKFVAAERVCKCGMPENDVIHSFTTEFQSMHKFLAQGDAGEEK